MPLAFELPGIGSLHVRGATRDQSTALVEEFGLTHTSGAAALCGEIEVVDRLGRGDSLTIIDGCACATDGNALFVLHAEGEAGRVSGISASGFTAQCTPCFPIAKLTRALVDLVALLRGLLPLHASAFVCDGRGIAVTGPPRSAKTMALLAFTAHGAEALGDERVYADPAARVLYRGHATVSTPVYRLRGRKNLLHTAGSRALWISAADAIMHPLTERTGERWARAWERRSRVALSVDSVGNFTVAPLHAMVVCVRQQSEAVHAERCDATHAAELATAATLADIEPAMQLAHGWRAALPDSADQVEVSMVDLLDRMTRLVSPVDTFVLRHPYPANEFAVFAALEPLINHHERTRDARAS